MASDVTRLDVVVHHRNDLPAGLPAVWIKDLSDNGTHAVLNLYLRDDLPQELADTYRCMAVRDTFPSIRWDTYTVTTSDQWTPTYSPLQFA